MSHRTNHHDPRGLQRLLHALVLAAAAGPLALTLAPVEGDVPACFACAERWLSDAAANVLLLAPLGGLLALRWRRIWLAVAIILLLSLAIEGFQTVLPGRHPSVLDVLLNVTGGAAGAAAALTARRWLAPPPRRGDVLGLWAAGGAGGALLLTAVLLDASHPEAAYFGQWTPDLPHLEHYRGRVLRATLGPLDIPPWDLDEPGRVRELLASDAALEVTALAGPDPSSLAPLVSIFDDREREVVLVGFDRDDLVFRSRTRAAGLGLDQPDVRFHGMAAAISPGDTFVVQVWRQANDLCARVAWAVRCEPVPGPARGWALVKHPEHLPRVARPFSDAAWLALLVLPFGFWVRSAWTGLVGVGMITLALVAGPALSTAGATRPAALLGVLAGVGAGVLLGQAVRAARSPRDTRTTLGPAGVQDATSFWRGYGRGEDPPGSPGWRG